MNILHMISMHNIILLFFTILSSLKAESRGGGYTWTMPTFYGVKLRGLFNSFLFFSFKIANALNVRHSFHKWQRFTFQLFLLFAMAPMMLTMNFFYSYTHKKNSREWSVVIQNSLLFFFISFKFPIHQIAL